MAQIIGGIATSHVPAIGGAIAQGKQQDPYWKPFFDGVERARQWVAQVRPDLVVMFYNDHGLNFFLDKMPTFAVGAAAQYSNADEGWGLPVSRPYPGDPALSWRIIERLVEDEFDVTTCQEMLVDHAFALPMQLLWPNGDGPPAVPIAINTVQHPLPSAARCLKLGRSVGRALAACPDARRVLVMGSGGLSHQLDGERAGFINKRFDLEFLDELITEPDAVTRHSVHDIVELAGTQGVELLMWLAMRGALGGAVRCVFQNYHIPISNTASCLLVMEPQDATARAA
jgi:protocatechuate 4,5-dioxygenase beta chain